MNDIDDEFDIEAIGEALPLLEGIRTFCSGGDQRIRGRDGYRYAEGEHRPVSPLSISLSN